EGQDAECLAGPGQQRRGEALRAVATADYDGLYLGARGGCLQCALDLLGMDELQLQLVAAFTEPARHAVDDVGSRLQHGAGPGVDDGNGTQRRSLLQAPPGRNRTAGGR